VTAAQIQSGSISRKLGNNDSAGWQHTKVSVLELEVMTKLLIFNFVSLYKIAHIQL
jgi:hypothetical protein